LATFLLLFAFIVTIQFMPLAAERGKEDCVPLARDIIYHL